MRYNGTRADEFRRYELEVNNVISKEINEAILIGHNTNYENFDSSYTDNLKVILVKLLEDINLRCPRDEINRFTYFSGIDTNFKGLFNINRICDISMTFNAKEFIEKFQKNYRLDTSDRQKFFHDIKNSVVSIGTIKSELSNLYMRKVYDRECVYNINPMFPRLTLGTEKALVITMEMEISINNQISSILVEAIADYYTINEFHNYVKRKGLLMDNRFILAKQLSEKKDELEDTFYCDPYWKQLKLDYPHIINGVDNLNKKLQKEVFNLGFDTTRVLKYAQSIKEYHNLN